MIHSYQPPHTTTKRPPPHKIRTRKRNIKLNLIDYGRAEEAHLDPRESFRFGAFIVILDVLFSDIDKRDKADSEVSDRFGFLSNLKGTEMRHTAGKLVYYIQSSGIEWLLTWACLLFSRHLGVLSYHLMLRILRRCLVCALVNL